MRGTSASSTIGRVIRCMMIMAISRPRERGGMSSGPMSAKTLGQSQHGQKEIHEVNDRKDKMLLSGVSSIILCTGFGSESGKYETHLIARPTKMIKTGNLYAWRLGIKINWKPK